MLTGSGYGAANVLTPSEAQDQAANASSAATASQLASATLPDKIAMSGDQRQTSALALLNNQKTSALRNALTDQQRVANAAALAQTPDQWDDAMSDLANDGVGVARQLIGRYSPQMKGRITNAFSANSPGSALASMQSDNPTGAGGAMSGLADVAGGGGAGVASGVQAGNWDQQFAQLPPQAVKALYDKTQAIKSAIQAVSQSSNPSATWDQEAVKMGHPEWAGHYSDQALQQLAQETVPLANYLQGRITREGIGVPTPKVPATIDNVGGTLYAIDHSDPANPKATPLTPQGKGVFVGTDKDGHGIYYDPVTGQETHGTADLATSRYTARGGGNSVYAQKTAAWLALHPGDEAGAMAFASGTKAMSPQQIQLAAQTQAARELSDLSLTPNPPADGEAFIRQRTAEIEQQLTAKSPGAPAATSPAPTASFTPAQQAARAQYAKNGAQPAGSKANPQVPRTQAEYNSIKAGDWFIDTDGVLTQKKR